MGCTLTMSKSNSGKSTLRGLMPNTQGSAAPSATSPQGFVLNSEGQGVHHISHHISVLAQRRIAPRRGLP